jgi:hypothetical protein
MDRHPEAPLTNRRHVLETVAAFLTDLVDNDKIKEEQLYTIFDQLKDPEKQLWLAENFSIQHQRWYDDLLDIDEGYIEDISTDLFLSSEALAKRGAY